MSLVTASLLGKEPWQLVPRPSQPRTSAHVNQAESDDEDLPPLPSPTRQRDLAVLEALERQRQAREAAMSLTMKASLEEIPAYGFPSSSFPTNFPAGNQSEGLVAPFELVFAEERVLNHLCALGATDLEISFALSHLPSKFTLMGAIYGYIPLEDTDFTVPHPFTTTKWEKLDSTEGIFESWLESIRDSLVRLEKAFMLVGKLFLPRSQRGKEAGIWTELVCAQIGQTLVLPFNPPKKKPHLLAMYEIMETYDVDQWEARVEVYVIDSKIIDIEPDDVDAVSYGIRYGDKGHGN
jgi:hypothetical protein